MKFGRRIGSGILKIVMPPRLCSDENTLWLVSTFMMSLYLVTDQYGPCGLVSQ